MPEVRELMNDRVVSVDPAASLLDAHRLLVDEAISGAPVVNEVGELEGVVTSTDLMRAVGEVHASAGTDTSYFRDLLPYSAPDWASGPEDFQDRLSEIRVSDVMTHGVVSVGPGASAGEVARMLMKHHIHRLFVVEEDTLLGVVSAYDLLRLIDD